MELHTKVSALALAITAVGSLFLAGCPTVEEACTYDTECDPGFVCEDTTCVQTCETTEDCEFTDEKCVPREVGEGKVCQIVGSNNTVNNMTNNATNNATGCNAESDPNGFCQNELNDPEALCDSATGMCELPMTEETFTVVQILDVTVEGMNSDACNGSEGPGSDIGYAVLLDENGMALGYASAVWDMSVLAEGDDSVANPNVSTTNLNGDAPSTKARDGGDMTCPASFDDSNVTSLGCGGAVFVEFLDENDNPLPIQAGYQIGVSEYSPACFMTNPGDDADSEDEFAIYGCTDADAASGGDEGSCNIELAIEAKGYVTPSVPASSQWP
jgi:predicted small secreted protein